MRPDSKLIRGLPLFGGLNDEQQQQIARLSELETFPLGHHFYVEGQEMNPAFLLMVSGSVEITRTAPSGKESVLRLIRPGEVFGAVAVDASGFFNQERHMAPTTATVIQEATVLTMDRGDMVRLVHSDPSIAIRMLVSVSERLVFLQESFHAAISERARTRVARQILYHLGDQPAREGPIAVPTLLSHQVLSRLAGITYEECVRIVREFAATPAILNYRRGGKIVVLDLPRLEAIARAEEFTASEATRRKAPKA